MRWIWCKFLISVAILGMAAGAPAAESVPDSPPAGKVQAPMDLKAGRSFWAFQPIAHPSPPAVNDAAWATSNVDRFVLAALEQKGLRPAPPATKLELVRRVYFDLTGLPPSPEQIKAFLDDTSAEAYEKLVDHLLDSPHYGERWAQLWLDVVRYAETEGFEYDRHLPEAWRYRDYVADSLNRDKPYDRFITEQVAGDEISPQDNECQTAAIFYRLGPVRRNAGNPDIVASRNEILTERTDMIGSAILGLTIGCARCHDHKFDPILQKDYYSLQAYLAATEEHDILLASPEERQAFTQKTAQVNAQLRRLRKEAEAASGEEKNKLNEQVEALEDTLPPNPATIPTIQNDFPHRTDIHILKRGEWERKGDAVGPRPPSVMVADETAELPADVENPRTKLAAWLVDPANPLTPRVIVNRLWQGHFGTGIVRTANNFGVNGERPTHPELLDFLASQFLNNGWHLKPIHRMLLLSSAYQQSSHSPSAEAATKLDPDDRLLWHFPPRRLSAEEIRDSMLAASGRINLSVGGPSIMIPVDPGLVQLLYKPSQWQVSPHKEDHYRRSIYLIAKRNLRLPFMEAFDQPALQTSCSRRESSTHAPQALELLNGKIANELADAFAIRLESECGGDTHRVIDRASWLALGRAPTAKEQELAAGFLRDGSTKEYALALFNLNGFLYVQ